MVTRPPHFAHSASKAFTLIEAVLALAISAVVLASIGGVFYSALRLRDRSVAALGETSRLQPVLNTIKRDLQGAMPAEGVMASVFRCGNLDAMLTGAAGPGIQFVTTTGTLEPDSPYGDLQLVSYVLRDSTGGARRSNTRELVRTVERNLLSTQINPPEEQLLLDNIQTFQIDCYDGAQWRNTWDTSFTDTNLPLAVRIQLEIVPQTEIGNPRTDSIASGPLEFIVPLMIQSRTNAPAEEMEEDTQQ